MWIRWYHDLRSLISAVQFPLDASLDVLTGWTESRYHPAWAVWTRRKLLQELELACRLSRMQMWQRPLVLRYGRHQRLPAWGTCKRHRGWQCMSFAMSDRCIPWYHHQLSRKHIMPSYRLDTFPCDGDGHGGHDAHCEDLVLKCVAKLSELQTDGRSARSEGGLGLRLRRVCVCVSTKKCQTCWHRFVACACSLDCIPLFLGPRLGLRSK